MSGTAALSTANLGLSPTANSPAWWDWDSETETSGPGQPAASCGAARWPSRAASPQDAIEHDAGATQDLRLLGPRARQRDMHEQARHHRPGGPCPVQCQKIAVIAHIVPGIDRVTERRQPRLQGR